MNKTEKICFGALIFIVTILFFIMPWLMAPDSVTYYGYLKIFRGVLPISAWDTIRGPVFPLIIYLGTLVFGDNVIGALSISYCFFLILLIVLFGVLNWLYKTFPINKTLRILIDLIIILFILFNPILFGYFHVLLTEFVAIPISLLSCCICWIWYEMDYKKEKVHYILCCLYFVLSFVFLWFLKQPYVSGILFPLFISIILSIIRDKSIQNILRRIGIFLCCIVCLILSISWWSNFLTKNGVYYEESITSQDFMVGGVTGGIINVRIDKNISSINLDNIKEIEFVSNDEEKIIKEDLSNDGLLNRTKIIEVISPSGELIDRMVYSYEGETFSLVDSVKLLFEILIKYPMVVLDSYFSGYLATINIYAREFNPDEWHIVKKFSPLSNENRSLGLHYLNDDDNYDWLRLFFDTSEFENLHSYKLFKLSDNKLINQYAEFHLVFFKFLYLLLPVLVVISIIKFFRSRKHISRNTRLYSFSVILLGSAFLHVIFHVVTGAIIDRYAFVVYPEIILGIILLIVGITYEKKTNNE
ncbi:hypothetical protein KBH77_03200 [Patescibacteria group bacterium]|nr:hypothetical protein [Patescibacteria group bacterium]